jgi:hypothetical protein
VNARALFYPLELKMQTSPNTFVRSAFAAAAAIVTLSAAQFAFAGEKAEAQLATPVAAPFEKIVDGRIWRCDGSSCVGATSVSARQPVKRECARAAKALGATFVSYKSGGRELAGDEAKACTAG